MKNFNLVFLLILLQINIFALELQWSNKFFDKIDSLQLYDNNYNGKNSLFISATSGIFSLDENKKIAWENRDFNSTNKFKFIDIDNDGKDEILLSNWLDIGIIDDDGSTISKWNIISNMSSHTIPSDFYMDNSVLKAVVADQGDSGNPPKIWHYSYNSSNKFFNFDWNVAINQYTYIPKNGLKIIDDKVVVLESHQFPSEDENYNRIALYNLSDGTLFSSTQANIFSNALVTFSVNAASTHLVVGDSSKKLYLIDLSNMSLLESINIDLSAKKIEFLEDKIFVYTDNSTWLNSGTEYITYEFDTNLKYINKNESTNSEIYPSANGIYDGQDLTLITKDYDIYTLNQENEKEIIFNNGLLAKKIFPGDIDSDGKDEIVLSDGKRTFLFDDDGKFLWSYDDYAIDIKIIDLNKDGINDIVFATNTKIIALDKEKNLLWEKEASNIQKFDVKDINNDGEVEIAYFSQDYPAAKIMIVKIDETVVLDYTLSFSGNCTYFKLKEINNINYVLFNNGSMFSLDLDGILNSIMSNSFIEYDTSNIVYDDTNNDGKDDLIAAFKIYGDGNQEIKFIDLINKDDEYGYDNQILGSILLPNNVEQVNSIKLFDYNSDGENELLVTTKNSISNYGDVDSTLYLYDLDGSIIWKYDTTISDMENNHFWNIEVINQQDGQHKIYVSGYQLYEFSKDGVLLNKIKPTNHYMVSSGGTYSNPMSILSDGNIILGQMGVFKIVTNNQAPLGTFNLNIKKGWNLISLPINSVVTKSELSSIFPNAQTIWKYNTSWEGYANGSFQEEMDKLKLDSITSIETGNGFWLNNNIDESIEFIGNSYEISENKLFKDTDSGWKLLGAGNSTNVDSLFEANNSINIIWTYKDEDWSVSSPDEYIENLIQMSNYKELFSINRGDGFWIKFK